MVNSKEKLQNEDKAEFSSLIISGLTHDEECSLREELRERFPHADVDNVEDIFARVTKPVGDLPRIAMLEKSLLDETSLLEGVFGVKQII